MPNMPRGLQPNSEEVLAARRDYVAEMMQREYPHWEEKPMAGNNAHRRFAWTDQDGRPHLVSCGAGTHSESDSMRDQQMLRSRIRVCEGGNCNHRSVVDVFGQPLSPEEAAMSESEGRAEPYEVGQAVIFNDEPHYVTERTLVDGSNIYGVTHAQTGVGDTATHEELMLNGQQRQSNILDPIHDGLDPDVWDYPNDDAPMLRPEHKQWIVATIYKHLDDAGYDGMDDWLSLVFTGSLTTYQYSEDSDVDVSLFVDTTAFPDWSRAEMIGVMVNNIDGTKVPGTTHPIQCFVVPPEVSQEDLYRPGLRSGYDIETDTWIQPPERDRVMDVEKEMNTAYTLALESADKMELLLKYEPQEAVRYWHYIHDKRREDQKAGKGDFAPSNIVYKMLANRGLFGEISEVSGEYIAKVAMPMSENAWSKMTDDHPYVYHLTDIDSLQDIGADGLLPWDDEFNATGTVYAGEPSLTPRPGHVYFTTSPDRAKGLMYGGGKALLRVPKSVLNHRFINPDEDVLREIKHQPDDFFNHLKPSPTTENWADEAERLGLGTDELDTDHLVDWDGSLAYQGSVRPENIEVMVGHPDENLWSPLYSTTKAAEYPTTWASVSVSRRPSRSRREKPKPRS